MYYNKKEYCFKLYKKEKQFLILTKTTLKSLFWKRITASIFNAKRAKPFYITFIILLRKR